MRRKRTNYRNFWLSSLLLMGIVTSAIWYVQQDKHLQSFIKEENKISKKEINNKKEIDNEKEKNDEKEKKDEKRGHLKSNATAKNTVKTNEPIELLFVGDILMDWSTKETMNQKGVDYPFFHVKKEISAADIAVANLENPLTTRDDTFKDQNQLYNFKSNPEHIQGVINAGFDLVSLANNHALDYGQEGLVDTIETLKENKLDYIGVGKTKEEAFQAKEYQLKGKKIKIMSASRFVPSAGWYSFHKRTKAAIAGAYDLDYLVQKVKEEKEQTDFLVLFLHWGVEKTTTPAEYQKVYVKQLVEAGVDAIIGSHPHWLQGFEYYEGVPVAYSLGNFLFPNYVNGNAAETGLLTLRLENNRVSMKFKPYQIKNDQIVPLSKEKENVILNKLEGVSYQATIEGYEIKETK